MTFQEQMELNIKNGMSVEEIVNAWGCVLMFCVYRNAL